MTEEDEESDYDDDDDDGFVQEDDDYIEEEEESGMEELERNIKQGIKRERSGKLISKHEKRKHKSKHKHKHKHRHHHHASSSEGENDEDLSTRKHDSEESVDSTMMSDEDADAMNILSSLSFAPPMKQRVSLTGFDAEDTEFLQEAWKELQQKQESSDQNSMQDQETALPSLEEIYNGLPVISPFVGNPTKSGCIRTEKYEHGKKPLLVQHSIMRFSNNTITSSAILASAALIPGTPTAASTEASIAAAQSQSQTLAQAQRQEQDEATAAAAIATTTAGAGRDSGRLERLQQRRAVAAYAGPAQFDESMMRKKKVIFERSNIHGWGLFALEPIPANDFIIEYVGELVRNTVADAREQRYTERGEDSSYMFRLDDQHIVDATNKGNFARFLNHSCEPNAYARTRVIQGRKRIIVYSLREIACREEITFDYKFSAEDDEHKIPCYCGVPNCRRFLN